MEDRYLVPPFSVIYANIQKWLDRKRKWVDIGIRSEIGRGGHLVYTMPDWMQRQAKEKGSVC